MKSVKKILAFLMVFVMAFSACVTVSAATKATSLKLNAATIKWIPGRSASFRATVTPSNASKTLKWTSSNPKVATVTSAGKLTSKAIGTTIITCATTDGSNLKVTCKVTVGKPVTSVKLNAATIKWPVGKSASFKATVAPSNAINKTLTWTSSNPKVATISQTGKLTSVGVGTTTITCKAKDGSGKYATCKVTVSQPKATSLKLNCKTINWNVGKSASFKATVTPANASKKLLWTSSNTSVATVTQTGKLTAVGGGTAIITCKTTDGTNLKATCRVTVIQPKAKTLSLNAETINWEVGKSGTLKAVVTPANASKTFEWTSSNPKVATITQSGKLTAVGIGTALIVCETTDGSNLAVSCKVTVKPLLPKATSLKLNCKTINWNVGKSASFKATVTPANASKTLSWSSSDTEVATVSSSGKLTAVGVGTATITCKTTDGSNLSVTCKVTVTLPKATDLEFIETEINLMAGESENLIAIVTPANASQAFKWSSSDAKVATITSSGKLTAIGAGTATITCKTTDGSGISATCEVTVIDQPKATELELNETEINLMIGESGNLTATVTPANASTELSWTSSDASVVKVEDGKLTTVGVGTATITCKTTDGSDLSATCEVTVIAKPKATSVELNETKINLETGESKSLTATVTPEKASKVLTWTSSDANVVKVEDGKLTAVGAGTATITCKTTDGSDLSATCEVTVTQPKATELKLSASTINLEIGKNDALKATVTPANASTTVTWTTSDDKVVTVTKSGELTAVGVGTATITCETTDGSNIKATCVVTVTEPKPEDEFIPMPATKQEVIDLYNKAVNDVKSSATSVVQTSEKFSNYNGILDLGSKFATNMAKPYLTDFFKEYTDRKEYKGTTEIVGAFPVAGQKTSNITADMVSSATCDDKGDYYELTIGANCSDSAPEVNPSKGSGKLGKMLNVYDVNDVLALIKASGVDIEIDFSNPKFSYGKGKLVAKIDKKTGKMTALYTDMAAIITAEKLSVLSFNIKNGKIGIELEHKWEINW